MPSVEGYGSRGDCDSDIETATTTAVPVKPVPTKPSQNLWFPCRLQNRPSVQRLQSTSRNQTREGMARATTDKETRTDGKGAGVSSLPSKLPAPKQAVPVKPPRPQRAPVEGMRPPFHSIWRPSTKHPQSPSHQ